MRPAANGVTYKENSKRNLVINDSIRLDMSIAGLHGPLSSWPPGNDHLSPRWAAWRQINIDGSRKWTNQTQNPGSACRDWAQSILRCPDQFFCWSKEQVKKQKFKQLCIQMTQLVSHHAHNAWKEGPSLMERKYLRSGAVSVF